MFPAANNVVVGQNTKLAASELSLHASFQARPTRMLTARSVSWWVF